MWLSLIASAVTQLVAGWPMVLALGGVLGAAGIRETRRRSALNEALHEVRRPLQVLALSAPGSGFPRGEFEGPVRMAAAALERLDREINGNEGGAAVRTRVRVGPLVEAAVDRWRGRAALEGRSLTFRCRCGSALVSGSPFELGQALDNLIANAVEHGGARIAVAATEVEGVLRIAVRDFGGHGGRTGGARSRSRMAARIGGTARHGHGLRIVRRIASEHGGNFFLHAGVGATEAVLELPSAGTAVGP